LAHNRRKKAPLGFIPAAPLLSQLSLRTNQQNAVGMVRKYLAAFGVGHTAKAALVHMATGSGKTGVIATLSRCIPEIGTTLVLAPRIALRNQLIGDISNRFFTHLQRAPKTLPKVVHNLEELVQDDSLPLGGSVIVGTIQLLETLKSASQHGTRLDRRKHAVYELLKQHLDLIIVDEGGPVLYATFTCRVSCSRRLRTVTI
jgi:superfamily II DNA or RNA helicase